ncbi:hypothetical protein KH5_18400 [Urechidicola sp. KH5]
MYFSNLKANHLSSTNNKLKLQYNGYRNTDNLWKGSAVQDIKQFNAPSNNNTIFNHINTPNLRLGKLVEQFVFNDLEQSSNIQILCENQQIKREKQTIGEIDCLLLKNDQAIHLEIVYKFYLFDSHMRSDDITCWIGPNRRDALSLKLNKLKTKQLPLLYKKESKPLLNKLGIKPENIEQQVLFKAQLFAPNKTEVMFNQLNMDCLCGTYVHYEEIKQFSNCEFYMPTKLDWLIIPHKEVAWLPFKKFKTQLLIFMKEKSAPLCWVKYPDKQIKKMFVVWWNY